jgi:hypothetical protein
MTTTSTSSSPARFPGNWLAKNKKPPGERAKIAVKILRGQATIDRPTAGQVAAICRVAPSTVSEALNGHRAPRPLNLKLAVKIFQAASPDQRREFVRGAGIPAVRMALLAASR